MEQNDTTNDKRVIVKDRLTGEDIVYVVPHETKNRYNYCATFVKGRPRMCGMFPHAVFHRENEAAQEMTCLIFSLNLIRHTTRFRAYPFITKKTRDVTTRIGVAT